MKLLLVQRMIKMCREEGTGRKRFKIEVLLLVENVQFVLFPDGPFLGNRQSNVIFQFCWDWLQWPGSGISYGYRLMDNTLLQVLCFIIMSRWQRGRRQTVAVCAETAPSSVYQQDDSLQELHSPGRRWCSNHPELNSNLNLTTWNHTGSDSSEVHYTLVNY